MFDFDGLCRMRMLTCLGQAAQFIKDAMESLDDEEDDGYDEDEDMD